MAKAKKQVWMVVSKVEDSGKGYDRLYVRDRMIATVDNGFVKAGESIRLYRGQVQVAA